jgi:predicted enzyme related to lactoylglutathione lyase
MANQIVWCDIPVLDLDRAIGFYSPAPNTGNRIALHSD